MVEININWAGNDFNGNDLMKISGTAVDDIYWSNNPLDASTTILTQLKKVYPEMQLKRNKIRLSEFKVGDKVKVIRGMFKGFSGEIVNIYEIDILTPLMIKLDDNDEFINCTCYLKYNDIEL